MAQLERHYNILLICVGLLPFSLAIARPRGVPLEKASFYQGGTEFRCLSNGKSIPMSYVNDDYCDCEDGSDEPGTSACGNGQFYCENKPYKGNYILSSRVNDGICDCCDGSDEYDGTIACGNTCEKMFAEIRAQQEALNKKREAGHKVKLEFIQQGKRTKDEKVARLTELEVTKQTLIDARTDAEELKNLAEDPEKAAKDKHEAAWNAVKEERKKAAEAVEAEKAFAELDVNKDGMVDIPELQSHSEFDIDSDGTVSDDEAKEYLEDGDQVDSATFVEKIWTNIKEIYKVPSEDAKDQVEETPTPTPAEETTTTEPDTDEKTDESDEEKMPDYDEDTKALIASADKARNDYNDADGKVRDMETEISGLKEYMELDFGPDQEFVMMKGQCFEYTDREYTYKLCPFDKTSQRSKSGGMETSLGTWGHWHGPESDKYDAMKYENGQGCWNGPSRTCHVILHCGAENALIGASEPSRCEYQFEFTTPARCESPNKLQHSIHEEL